MSSTRYRLLFLVLVAITFQASAVYGQTVIATIPVGTAPAGGVVDQATNTVYVGNGGSNSVSVINGANNTVITTVPLASSPNGGDVNPASNKGYVALQNSNVVTVIDANNNYATHNVNGFTGQGPRGVAINPATDRIYVASRNTNDVAIIDGSSDSVVGSPISVGFHPNAIKVNPVTNKIYVANQGTNTVTIIDANNGNAVTTVTVGNRPVDIAIDAARNKIYVANQNDNTLSVIDGSTNTVSSPIATGVLPVSVTLNAVTNKIYISANNNGGSGSITVVDGNTLTPSTITVGTGPTVIAANPITNTIYVANNGGASVSVIDGGSNTVVSTVPVGNGPVGVFINDTTNRIYVSNSSDNTVSVIAGASPPALRFVPVTPCRVADTRNANGTFGGPSIGGQTSRSFPVPQSSCGIPSAAAAYSLNVTVVPQGLLGYLTLWPTGLSQPLASTLNSLDGRVKANAAIVPAGAGGAVSVFVTNTTDVILDIDGYFVAATDPTALAFYPLQPCRVADTRSANGPLGGPNLAAGVPRGFPVLNSVCNVPSSALAYSMNLTAIPRGPLGYLSLWPTGSSQPVVSTLNALTGQVTANAAIVPAGMGGDIEAFVTNDADLVIDINGYFAPANSAPNPLSLYALPPCRVVDTRNGGGAFSGTLVVNTVAAPCGVPTTAQSFVMNATVVPAAPLLGYLTLWPDGVQQPVVSTLNALDGMITSNMAIVPTANGSIDAFATDPTQLILDIFSYFAP